MRHSGFSRRVERAPVDLGTVASVMPTGILIIDAEEKVIYANPAAESFLGRPGRRDADLRCGDFLLCRNRTKDPSGCGYSVLCPDCHLWQAIRAALREERRQFITGETEIFRDSGLTSIWLKYQAGALFLEGRKCVLLALDDITGRKQMELKLVERADFAQRILDATDTHIAVVGDNGKILAVNRAWRRFARENGGGGGERRWGPGADYFQPCPAEDPDASLAEKAYTGIRRVQRAELTHFVEAYPCHSPEEQRWFEMHVLPMPGDAGQVLVSHQNITRQKLTEGALKTQNANLAAILENTDDLIASRDDDGRLVFFNSAFDRMVQKVFGRPAEPGMKTTDLLPPEMRPHWERTLSRVLGGERIRQEFDWLFDDHQVRHFEISLNPIRRGGDIIGATEFTHDISLRKEAEINLQRSYDDLVLREKTAQLFLTAEKDRVFKDVLASLLNAFESRYGFLGYLDESGRLVCPSMTHDACSDGSDPERGTVFPRDQWTGLWGKCLIERRACLQNRPFDPPSGGIRLQNAMAAPMLTGWDVVGQVVLADKPGDYTAEDLERLEAIARFIAPVLRIFLERDRAVRKLRHQASKLEEKNIALNVLLETREAEKKDLADKIRCHFQKMVYPYMNRIRGYRRQEDIETLLQIIEKNIQESLSPLEKFKPSHYRGFTPMEIQVADLIQAGKTSKEIADLLCISTRSVFFHRNNIRKKLTIDQTGVNLRAHLMSLS